MQSHIKRDHVIQIIAWSQQNHWWIAAIPGVLASYFFGDHGNAPVFYALRFIMVDLVTGLLKGASGRILNSRVAYHGALRKAAMISVIMLGHAADVTIGSGDAFKGLLAYWVCSVELCSIFENLAVAGIMVPDQFKVLFRGFIHSDEPHYSPPTKTGDDTDASAPP